MIPTDLDVAVPHGTYGRLASRSGLTAKHHLALGAGVIDAGFRGNVKILLFNHGKLDFHVPKCNRIAQLLLERFESPPVVVVTQLPGTNGGYEGFGSTWMAVLEAGGWVVATPPVSSDGPDPSEKQSLVPMRPSMRLVDVSLPFHPFRQTGRIAEISMRMGHS